MLSQADVPLRICIVGTSVIGGILAARPCRAGRIVSAIARGPHLAAIRSNGLILRTVNEVIARIQTLPIDLVLTLLRGHARYVNLY
jgi:ketopantoate reductase